MWSLTLCLRVVETVPHCCWSLLTGFACKSCKFEPFHLVYDHQYVTLKAFKWKAGRVIDRNRLLITPSTFHTQIFKALLTGATAALAELRFAAAAIGILVQEDVLVDPSMYGGR